MSKLAACILIGVMIGLLCGFFGIPIDNYEKDKCSHLNTSTNQEYYNYELQKSCYMPIEKPEWNLFWCCFGMIVFGIIIFGLVGLVVGAIIDEL